jgi:uncharacterized protein YyaL (SSP411 family)
MKFVSDEEAATEQTTAVGSSKLTSQRAYVCTELSYVCTEPVQQTEECLKMVIEQ